MRVRGVEAQVAAEPSLQPHHYLRSSLSERVGEEVGLELFRVWGFGRVWGSGLAVGFRV